MTIPRLVTFDDAKSHLNVDHDQDDVKIELVVQQACAIVLNYLNQYARDEYESLPVYDPENPVPVAIPWPWMWVTTAQPPYWWPATKVSYQQLAPYVADQWDLNGSPTGVVPGAISAATLLVVGALYRDREGGDPLSAAARALLDGSGYRDLPMA